MMIYPNRNTPSVGTMIRALTAYIPHSIHQVPTTASLPNHYKVDDNGQQLIQEVVNDALRIYGSAQELAEHLKTFSNVSCDSELFRMDICETSTRTPEMFESQDGSKYMLKQDFLVQLQNMVYAIEDLLKVCPFAQAFLALFLNLKEQDLRGTREFARCDERIESKFAEQGC